MTQIQQIKAEIESLKQDAIDYPFEEYGTVGTCDKILSFIEALEKEQPISTKEKKESLFLELNSVLVKFWIEHGRPDNEIRIELLKRMIHWYKNEGTITMCAEKNTKSE